MMFGFVLVCSLLHPPVRVSCLSLCVRTHQTVQARVSLAVAILQWDSRYTTLAAALGASHVTRHTSHVTRHTSHVTRHMSHVHTSHVTRRTSHVTLHTSHRTPHTMRLLNRSLPTRLCLHHRASTFALPPCNTPTITCTATHHLRVDFAVATNCRTVCAPYIRIHANLLLFLCIDLCVMLAKLQLLDKGNRIDIRNSKP
jgi:hypothetical protein